MNTFLKDNIAIVAAIVLPLLLALVFAFSTMITQISVENPKYDFLITDDYYSNNSTFLINIVKDKLVISYRPPQKDANGNYLNNTTPRLWRVHVPDMKVEQISLPEPANKVAIDIKIPGITDVTVRNIDPGPDDYSYISSYDYNNNIMSEIFDVDHNSRYRVGIFKNGRTIPIRIGDGHSYYNTQFIGWIMDKGE